MAGFNINGLANSYTRFDLVIYNIYLTYTAMNSIGKSLFYSALGQYSVHIVSFATIVVLARLLTPEEIGVYAVAGSLSILATELRSVGIGQYLVREKELDSGKIRNALGISVTVSWSLGFLIALLAPLAADYYQEPAIKHILWILCVSFLFGPFASVPYALWTRAMRFQMILVQRLSSTLVYAASSIIFVLLDFSYYGLALGATMGFICELVIAVVFRPPSATLKPSFRGMGKLVKFGFYTSASNLFGRFAESIPDLVIGRIGTMADVGIFSRGMGVILFISKIISSGVFPVVLPHFSNVNREGKSVAEAYLRAIKLQLSLSWPVFAVVSVSSYPLIHALFGTQWDQAVPIASTIAIWAMFVSVHVFSAPTLISTGGERIAFFSGLVTAMIRLTMILVTAPYGLGMIAWGIVASGAFDLVFKSWVLRKATGLSVRQMITEFVPNALISVICCATALLLDFIMPFRETNPYLVVAVLLVTMAITWLVSLRITRHESWTIISNIAIRVLFQRRPAE